MFDAVSSCPSFRRREMQNRGLESAQVNTVWTSKILCNPSSIAPKLLILLFVQFGVH